MIKQRGFILVIQMRGERLDLSNSEYKLNTSDKLFEVLFRTEISSRRSKVNDQDEAQKAFTHFGSIMGSSHGSEDFNVRVPRLTGRRRQT